jgi:hypothetical protein
MKTIAAIILSLVCSVSFGQIKLVEQTSETWAGMKSAKLNDDGTITTGPGSKPVIIATSTKYSFETAVTYKFGMLKVKRKSTGEKVSMDKDSSAEIYSFRSGATPGVYEFSYTVYDPDKGMDSDEWAVDYKPIVPGPIVEPKPVDPQPGVLTGVAEEARVAMRDYVRNMAGDMRTAAKEIDGGQLKTALQVQQRGQALDLATRTNWKQSIGTIMNKYQSEPPTKELFIAIAAGYEAVK